MQNQLKDMSVPELTLLYFIIHLFVLALLFRHTLYTHSIISTYKTRNKARQNEWQTRFKQHAQVSVCTNTCNPQVSAASTADHRLS